MRMFMGWVGRLASSTERWLLDARVLEKIFVQTIQFCVNYLDDPADRHASPEPGRRASPEDLPAALSERKSRVRGAGLCPGAAMLCRPGWRISAHRRSLPRFRTHPPGNSLPGPAS